MENKEQQTAKYIQKWLPFAAAPNNVLPISEKK